MLDRIFDLPTRLRRRISGDQPDYREFLFEELVARLGGRPVRRVLEIGPRDGIDSRRLLDLNPDRLVLVDLPDKEERVRGWLPSLPGDKIEFIIGNMMYDQAVLDLPRFDVVWCTGVLYHNPEQLRMIRQLFDFIEPGGLLVIESATARRRRTRDENCVEIWHKVDKSVHRAHHVSSNVTHLPSRLAIRSWLEMVGFAGVERSDCHRRVSRTLAGDRAAFIAERPMGGGAGTYYKREGMNYDIGKSH